jgi:hypothetical protein
MLMLYSIIEDIHEVYGRQSSFYRFSLTLTTPAHQVKLNKKYAFTIKKGSGPPI